jgi:hypothetical protein
MHLYREVTLGIDELDEQGEGGAEAFVVIASHKAFTMLLDKFHNGQSAFGTLGYHRQVAGHGRELPTLAHLMKIRGYLLEREDTFTAPYQLL